MTEFVSEIKTLPYANDLVYGVLSDLNNLEYAKDKIPEDKIKDFTFDSDSCTVSVPSVGMIKFVIVERIPVSTLKFEARQLPFALTIWAQFKPTDQGETKMKITLRAELNAFLKPMVSKPLQQGVNRMADLLACLPYPDLSRS